MQHVIIAILQHKKWNFKSPQVLLKYFDITSYKLFNFVIEKLNMGNLNVNPKTHTTSCYIDLLLTDNFVCSFVFKSPSFSFEHDTLSAVQIAIVNPHSASKIVISRLYLCSNRIIE